MVFAEEPGLLKVYMETAVGDRTILLDGIRTELVSRNTAIASSLPTSAEASCHGLVRAKPWRSPLPRAANCGKITGTPPRTAWPVA